MTHDPGPTVRRRQLGKELRRLRENAGKTITEAAVWVGIKPPTVSKIENGRQAIRPTNVRLLLQLYGVEAPDADTLIRLAGEVNQRGWWASYGDTVPDWFRNFVGLEADASEINGYESELVPGQLQTAEYAKAVMVATRQESTEDELQRLVTFRRERQERLTGNTPPRLHFVLNEAVVRRPVGGAEAFGKQLDYLAEIAELPHIDIQVLPYSAGPHATMGQTFTMLRFPGDEAGLDFVYLENDRGALYLERPADVQRYQTIFTQLATAALDSSETRKFLATVSRELTGERE
ncbi:MAG: helix-turn-helix domain-containing protein [Pseudonocardiaceae bacterium]